LQREVNGRRRKREIFPAAESSILRPEDSSLLVAGFRVFAADPRKFIKVVLETFGNWHKPN